MRAGVDDVTAPVKGVLLAPKRSLHILCRPVQERDVKKGNMAGSRKERRGGLKNDIENVVR